MFTRGRPRQIPDNPYKSVALVIDLACRRGAAHAGGIRIERIKLAITTGATYHENVRGGSTCLSSLLSVAAVSLSDVDRELLQRCLDRQGNAWNDFVDRFVGLVIHVVNRTALGRGHSINEATRDDLVAEVFLVFLRNDFAALRRFRRQCSLATYLTVVARRVVVRELLRLENNPASVNGNGRVHAGDVAEAMGSDDRIQRIENVEQVEALLMRLDQREASIVRMFHLEGKSYREIGQAVGIAENSVGPVLHRAREKMRG